MKLLALSWVSQGRGDPEAWARRKRHLSRRARGGMSFWLSFHLPLLSLTGAHWLDDPPELSSRDSTHQYAVDDPLLSCNPLLRRVRRSRLEVYAPLKFVPRTDEGARRLRMGLADLQ